MFTIYKKVEFAAAHELRGLGGEHPCSSTHGHTYTVEVWLTSKTLLSEGWVADFGVISRFIRAYDHSYLNAVKPFDTVNPTAENLAYELYELIAGVPGIEALKVRGWESLTSYAEYEE